VALFPRRQKSHTLNDSKLKPHLMRYAKGQVNGSAVRIGEVTSKKKRSAEKDSALSNAAQTQTTRRYYDFMWFLSFVRRRATNGLAWVSFSLPLCAVSSL
jgi:hypothetical protein